MKKKDETLDISLDKMHIYRDDIEQIYDIFTNTHEDVLISIDNYLLDSVDEIGQIPQETASDVEISINSVKFNNHLSLKLRIHQSYANITSLYPDMISEAMAYKIQNVIEKRKRKNVQFIEKSGIKVVGIFTILMFLIYYAFGSANIYVKGISAILFLIGCTALITFMIFSMSKYSNNIICLKYQKEKPSFLYRNKDTIILNIVFLIIGGLFGVWFGKIFTGGK